LHLPEKTRGERKKKIKENEDKNIIENENKKSLVFFFLDACQT
jgi:hypothetical protein